MVAQWSHANGRLTYRNAGRDSRLIDLAGNVARTGRGRQDPRREARGVCAGAAQGRALVSASAGNRPCGRRKAKPGGTAAQNA